MAEEVESTPEGETSAPPASKLRGLLEEQVGENEALKRRLAFVEAGVDPESDEARMIQSNIEGDISPDAVTETRTRLLSTFGGSSEPKVEDEPADPESPTRDDAVEFARARRDLTDQGAEKLPEAPEPDTMHQAYVERREARQRGVTDDDANAIVTQAIISDVLKNGAASPHTWEGWDRHQEKQATRSR